MVGRVAETRQSTSMQCASSGQLVSDRMGRNVTVTTKRIALASSPNPARVSTATALTANASPWLTEELYLVTLLRQRFNGSTVQRFPSIRVTGFKDSSGPPAPVTLWWYCMTDWACSLYADLLWRRSRSRALINDTILLISRIFSQKFSLLQKQHVISRVPERW